jgi:hypothetical protein
MEPIRGIDRLGVDDLVVGPFRRGLTGTSPDKGGVLPIVRGRRQQSDHFHPGLRQGFGTLSLGGSGRAQKRKCDYNGRVSKGVHDISPRRRSVRPNR